MTIGIIQLSTKIEVREKEQPNKDSRRREMSGDMSLTVGRVDLSATSSVHHYKANPIR